MRADEEAATELYHRAKEDKDIVPAAYFRWDNKPDGFLSKDQLFPDEGRPPYPPVIIHHKFIVINGGTDHGRGRDRTHGWSACSKGAVPTGGRQMRRLPQICARSPRPPSTI